MRENEMTIKTHDTYEEEAHYDNLDIGEFHIADRSTCHHKMLKNNGHILNLRYIEVSVTFSLNTTVSTYMD